MNHGRGSEPAGLLSRRVVTNEQHKQRHHPIRDVQWETL